ncbi:MAG: hypothetical protein R3C56_25300 [Pirellulaceae bacterium]
MRVAFEDEVRRGSLLSDKSRRRLDRSQNTVIKVKKDQPIDSRATVVDIRGGKPLAGDSATIP